MKLTDVSCNKTKFEKKKNLLVDAMVNSKRFLKYLVKPSLVSKY